MTVVPVIVVCVAHHLPRICSASNHFTLIAINCPLFPPDPVQLFYTPSMRQTMNNTHDKARFIPGDAKILNEGYLWTHRGDIAFTFYVDFRPLWERTPIQNLVKLCEAEYALESNRVVQVARPGEYRKAEVEGVQDDGECSVKMDVTVGGVSGARELTLTWGERDVWLFCTAITPTSQDERLRLWNQFPSYDHETPIQSPRRFAQSLCQNYLEVHGPPDVPIQTAEHTLNNVTLGQTSHKQLVVYHGPVRYHDNLSAVAVYAQASSNPIDKLFPMFVKSTHFEDQREYRFLIFDRRGWECVQAPASIW